jgi:hypothetical protein
MLLLVTLLALLHFLSLDFAEAGGFNVYWITASMVAQS